MKQWLSRHQISGNEGIIPKIQGTNEVSGACKKQRPNKRQSEKKATWKK